MYNFKEPFVLKNFIEKHIVDSLNQWTVHNYGGKYFSDANMGLEGTRLTTRYFRGRNILYPNDAFLLQRKIIQELGLVDFLYPNYSHGIVNGIGFEGGDIYEHVDPVYHSQTMTVHCNAITQNCVEGGITIIENHEYPTSPGDLLVYPVSELQHRVTTVRGTVPRILWVFGFCLPINVAEKNLLEYM